MWQRAFRLAWGIDAQEPVELAVESIQVNPARALAAIFSESPVHVYADGLMSYGPTRDRLPLTIGCRIRRLLHLDLIPGLRPMLLSEFGVEPEIVPDAAFRAVLDEVAADAADDPRWAPVLRERPTAVLLGQYLAALGILTASEEEDLHVRMLAGAARAGHRSVVFKPHPTAPPSYSAALSKAAADAGVRLTVLDAPLLAETLYHHCRPELVVGCFSTAMVTASVYYEVPVARVGTALVMERLTPYPNSNRIPLALVDRLVPDLESGRPPALVGTAPTSLTPLVRALGFCMQPKTYEDLREPTAAWLRAHLAGSPATGSRGAAGRARPARRPAAVAGAAPGAAREARGAQGGTARRRPVTVRHAGAAGRGAGSRVPVRFSPASGRAAAASTAGRRRRTARPCPR